MLLLLTIICSSCKKRLDVPAPTPVVTEETTSPAKINAGKLGSTWNMTEPLETSRIKGIAIDNAALVKDAPNRLIIDEISDQYNRLEAGENMVDFAEQVSRRIKASAGFWIFKSTVSHDFSETNTYSAKYIYASYNRILQKRSLKYNASASILRKYLTKEFQEDIASDSPQEIVARYGTSVLSHIIEGARFESLYQSETSATDRKSAASAGISLSIKEIFDISVEPGTNKSLASSNSNQRLLYQTIGGDNTIPITGDLQLGSTVSNTVNINAWQQSVNSKNAQLVDIGTDGLIPLDELISDPVKAAAVKAYIKEYITSRQVTMIAAPIPVYHYYADRLMRHLYSTEKLPSIGGIYLYQGPAFKAYNAPLGGSVPIYQHYNAARNATMLSAKNPCGVEGYAMQGIAFYAYTSPVAGTVQFYDYFMEAKMNKVWYYSHYYSPSTTAPSNEWSYRYGNSFYAFPN